MCNSVYLVLIGFSLCIIGDHSNLKTRCTGHKLKECVQSYAFMIHCKVMGGDEW